MKYDYVEGHGPSQCKFMVVAEAPAQTECETGIPLTGRTGVEFDNLLNRYIGIPRGEIYVTNLFHYPLNDKKEFTQAELEWQGAVLREEIEKVNPDVILSLGAISTHWFLGHEHDMETLNGMPHKWEGRIVVPSIHPAAIFRDSALLSWVIEAFQNTKKVIGNPAAMNILQSMDKLAEIEFPPFSIPEMVAIDTEALNSGTPYLVTLSLRGSRVGYCYAEDKRWVKHIAGRVDDENVVVLLHNALYDLPQLWKLGIYPHHWLDTMHIAFLLQTLPLGLKGLAYRLCRMKMREYDDVVWGDIVQNFGVDIKQAKKMFPNRDLSDVSEEERLIYACADADATIRVYNMMLPLWYPNMWELLQRDMDIMPMIIAMMERGMKVDVKYLEELGTEFEVENLTLLAEIHKMAIGAGWTPSEKSKKKDFNPKSSQQVSKLIYECLKIGKGYRIDKTKDGNKSTGAKTLKKIEGEHSVVAMIEEYRQRKDLKDKYIDVLPEFAQTDGRVHAKISMVRVAQSGRLAASKPNLLAQPVRSSDGRRIRDGFVAEDGYSIVSLDYNQIEMRILAHESQDPVLLNVYRNNGDVHTDTAMRIFGITDPSQVDEIKQRYPSKRTGFLVIYRGTGRGLSIQLQGEGLLEWDEKKCNWIISSWLNEHLGVPAYWDTIDRETKLSGQICDMWGRMKLIPEVRSVYKPIREAGLRKAGNVPMQAGAQGIIKEAMSRIWDGGMREWTQEGLVYPLIQVHDDLTSEVRDDFIQEYVSITKPIMESVVELSIPIVVEPKVGKRWGSQVKYNGVTK